MLNDILSKIDSLKQEFESLHPLKGVDRERLWKKIRLEWDYNSNHMEGSTLTYGETELLLYKGDTIGNHTIREYDEMKGHDLALHMVYEYADDKERGLNESFIRQLNKTILKEPFWSPAITADGQPTQKQIIPGEYKSTPNSVRTATGEIFNYPSPEDTRIQMPELIEWYKENLNLHPVLLAAEMHYRLVSIHPFDDGNGRVSRLIMNYILIKHGYQPAIIKSKDKQNYIRCLNLADTIGMEAFHNYIAEQAEWSLKLSIKAAKGENIEEADDLDKEIDLLNRDFKNKEVVPEESYEYKISLLKKSFIPIMETAYNKMSKFNNMFAHHSSTFYPIQNNLKKGLGYGHIEGHTAEQLIGSINQNISLSQYSYEYDLSEFLKNGPNVFSCRLSFSFQFDKYKYSVIDNKNQVIYEKKYNEFLTLEEMEKLVNDGVRNVLETIKQNTGK